MTVWDWLIAPDITRQGRGEKDKLRYSNSQLNHCINNLKALCKLKKTLISCSDRAELAKNQTQNLVFQLAELQPKMNSQPHRVPVVKLRAVIAKEWDPGSWMEMCGEILMTLRQGAPKFWRVGFVREAASPPSSKGIKRVLHEEIMGASLRKSPCKTMVRGLRTHPYHPSLLLHL